jgi:hypothetical protein
VKYIWQDSWDQQIHSKLHEIHSPKSLHFIDIRNIEISDNSVQIRIGDLLKYSRRGTNLQELILKSFPENEKLYIVKNLSTYIESTKDIR